MILEKMKAGTAGAVTDLRKIAVQASASETNPQPIDLQVRRLVRNFALPATWAAVVAPHAYGEGRS